MLPRSARSRPGAEDEEIHELSRRGGRAHRTVPAPDPPGSDEGRLLPCVRGFPEPRGTHAAGTAPAGTQGGRSHGGRAALW